MKLFTVNISYGVEVEQQNPELSIFSYDKASKRFIEKGTRGNYIKNDLIQVIAEQDTDLIDVIKQQMGIYGEDLEIQIIDVIDLDNVIRQEEMFIDEDGNTQIIPAVKGKVVFQGGFDIYKEELKDLLDDAINLLYESEAL